MPDDNSPQLGGQRSDDNAPMISGRGTKIIVSARGAYEARSFRGLFAAMNADQRMMFRQAFVRQVLTLIRPDYEEADETESPFAGFLSAFDDWLIDPSGLHCDEIRDWYSRAREFGNSYFFRGRRLQCLTVAILTDDLAFPKSIFAATNALESDADWLSLAEPHRSVIAEELREWIIEVGWAILHAREVPSLRLDWTYIKALGTDAELWYRKRNLTPLVCLMTSDNKEQFIQAIRQQAIGYIDAVPASLWTNDEQQVIEQARQWLSNPDTLLGVDYQIFQRLINRHGSLREYSPSGGAVAALVGVFSNRWIVCLANIAVNVGRYVRCMHKKLALPPLSIQSEQISHHWQIEAAYAILTNQPIPPLGDPDAR